MQNKIIAPIVLGIVGVYFLVFHTAPLPLNHDSIGFPPYHMVHSVFGIILLAAGAYIWHKGKKK